MRHNEIIPQFAYDPLRPGLYERIGRGLILFFIGFVEKFFIADRLAGLVDPVFTSAQTGVPPLSEAVSGALAFSLQILFDFVAYSNMAMGIGLMLGLMLPVNFNVPYRALNLRDFWRRWHITLSRWIRDYIYIPLGGSREGTGRYITATLITMGLCGLWHGAGWTFVLWGLGHGVGLLICRAWQLYGFKLPSFAAWAITLLYVVLLFVLFRAADLETASRMFESFIGHGGWGELWPWADSRSDCHRGRARADQHAELRDRHAHAAELAGRVCAGGGRGDLRARSRRRPAAELHLFPVLILSSSWPGCPGHPRFLLCRNSWMPGMKPGMTRAMASGVRRRRI